jgi:hypothetical protein
MTGATMPDGGPIYCETGEPGFLAEPWNTWTELAFVLLALYWAWRLRGRYHEHRFVAICLPLILVGGLGGFLFHGFRTQRIFLMIDVIPILVLLPSSAAYLCYRITGRVWAGLAYALGLVVAAVLLFRSMQPGFRPYALVYVLAAVVMALPVVIEAVRNRGRGTRYVVGAVACAGVGSAFHLGDGRWCEVLPMGTHWLWHVLAAAAVHLLIAYLVATDRPVA